MSASIGKSTTGQEIRINVERLIETKLLITARSGGGKSYAIRRLLEQTHGQVQQIVIDVEDEFYTLREKYDYVLAGRQGGDCPADPRCAALLARKLLELRVSAIIGIYELKAHERIQFVRLFLESLVDSPKELWHPVMIVIDEAQLFCPEGTKCESKAAVIDLQTRGRKRGFLGVLASQRISSVDKDATAQCWNKLVGGFSQDIDVERAAKDLGFFKKEQRAWLQNLKPGSFFAVGPALCEQVTELTVGQVVTTHPRAGQRAMAPPPPAESVRRVLSQLADLPHEAEREAVTISELQKQIRELRARAITREQRVYVVCLIRQQYEGEIRALRTAIQRGRVILLAADDSTIPNPTPLYLGLQRETKRIETLLARDGNAPNGTRDDSADGRILRALAMVGAPASKRQVGVLSGVNPKKSTWRASMASLKQSGMITVNGDTLTLTDAGRAASRHLPAITSDERVAMWRDKFDSSANKIFDALRYAIGPMTKDQLGDIAGIDPRISTWRAAMAQIRASGFLVENGGMFSLDRDLLGMGK